MKTAKGTVLCCMSILLAIVALGCGNAIESAANGREMLGYTFLALAVFLVALILAAIGVSTENKRTEQENRKIKRIPHHTNEWRDAK
jgi:hypothetical protein